MMEAKADITCVGDIADAALKAQQRSKSLMLWWRGQGDASWKLRAGVFRKKRGSGYESSILILFKQGAAPRYRECPAEDDYPGWLFLAQHYGLPTRLLDWTQSALAAAYFAVWETRLYDCDGTLWVLNPKDMLSVSGESLGVVNPLNSPAIELFDQPFLTNVTSKEKVVAVLAREIDLRMTMQQSAFTIHEDESCLDENPGADGYLVKYRIPKECKRELIMELRRLGIKECTLFPDLAHLAADVKRYIFRDKGADDKG